MLSQLMTLVSLCPSVWKSFGLMCHRAAPLSLFRSSFFSSHLCSCVCLFIFTDAPICFPLTIPVCILLTVPSSLCLCSNLCVSHLVKVVSKSHFLDRNTLAAAALLLPVELAGCPWQLAGRMGDGLGHSHADNWHLARCSYMHRAFPTYYVSFSPRTIRRINILTTIYWKTCWHDE